MTLPGTVVDANAVNSVWSPAAMDHGYVLLRGIVSMTMTSRGIDEGRP